MPSFGIYFKSDERWPLTNAINISFVIEISKWVFYKSHWLHGICLLSYIISLLLTKGGLKYNWSFRLSVTIFITQPDNINISTYHTDYYYISWNLGLLRVNETTMRFFQAETEAAKHKKGMGRKWQPKRMQTEQSFGHLQEMPSNLTTKIN